MWTGTHWQCSICDRKGQQLRRAACAAAVTRVRAPLEDLCDSKARRVRETEVAQLILAAAPKRDLREDTDLLAGLAEPIRRFAAPARTDLQDADQVAGMAELTRRVAAPPAKDPREVALQLAGLEVPIRRGAKRTGVGQGGLSPLPERTSRLAPFGDQGRVSRRRLREQTRQVV